MFTGFTDGLVLDDRPRRTRVKRANKRPRLAKLISRPKLRVTAAPSGKRLTSVFLPFFDCAGQLLTTRLNVTHHQAPIFALTLCSLLVDSFADTFKCSFQSVD